MRIRSIFHLALLLFSALALAPQSSFGILLFPTIQSQVLPVSDALPDNIALGAYSTTGLPVSYTTSDPATAIIVTTGAEPELAFLRFGTVTVTASAGGANLSQEVSVKISRSLTYTPPATEVAVGTPLDLSTGTRSFEPEQSDVSEPLEFEILSGPGTLDGTELRIISAGVVRIEATAPGDDVLASASTEFLIIGLEDFDEDGMIDDGGPGFQDRWTWRRPERSPDLALNDGVAGANEIVLVGNGGRVLSTDDPDDTSAWISGSAGTADLAGVTFDGSDYLAVGTDGSVWSSLDGGIWSPVPTVGIDPGTAFTAIRTGGGVLVGIGVDDTGSSVLYTSNDGQNWLRDNAFPSLPNRSPEALAFSSALNQWSVVGESGLWLTGSPGAWTQRTLGTAQDFNAVHVTNGGVTYIVGDQGSVIRTEAESFSDWETVFTGVDFDLLSISDNGRFLLAVGEGGQLIRSRLSNGTFWTSGLTPFGLDLQGVLADDNRFLTFGENLSVSTSSNGYGWTKRYSSDLEGINGVASGDGLLVAVGDAGRILTSADAGVNWAEVSSGTTEDLTGISYRPDEAAGLFVAVGGNGTILTSENGSTWTDTAVITDSPSGFDADLTAVFHSPQNGFVAVGEEFSILHSSDGQTWSRRTSGVLTLTGVTARNGTFVTVGEQGLIWTSPDGLSWTGRSSGITNDLWAVAASEEGFLAVGADGIILTSHTGVQWETRISSVTIDLRSVIYAADSFYAFGEGFAYLSSPDGISWRAQTMNSENGFRAATLFIDDSGTEPRETFVATTDFGGILTAPTVETTGLDEWTFRDPSVPGVDINDVVFGNNGFVAVGDEGMIMLSDDGRNWVERTVLENDGTTVTEDFVGVAYGNGIYLAVSDSKIVSSPDARNWNVITTWTVPATSVTFAEGLFVTTGEQSQILWSLDGLNWSGGSVNGIHASGTLYDAAYSEELGLWTAVGDPSNFVIAPLLEEEMTQLFISETGTNWTRVFAPLDPSGESPYFVGSMRTVSAGEGRFRTFGVGGRLVFNPISREWDLEAGGGFDTFASLFTRGNGEGGFIYAGQNGAIAGVDPSFLSFPNVTDTLNGLAFGLNTYVAVGANGRILYSFDGRNWSVRTNADFGAIRSVAVDAQGRYASVGDDALILTSPDSIRWSSPADVPELTGNPRLNDVAVWPDEGTALQNGFVAVGQFGTILSSNQGGETWSAVETGLGLVGNLNGIAVGDELLAIVGDGGQRLLYDPRDENNPWTVPAGGDAITTDLFDIAHGNGTFLAVGDGAIVIASRDGLNWYDISPPAVGIDLLAVGYGRIDGEAHWVVAGQTGTLFALPDGNGSWDLENPPAWEVLRSASQEDLETVSFGQSNFLAAGSGGAVVTANAINSTDWLSRDVNTAFTLHGSAFFNGVFTLVGEFGTIITSGRIEEREDQQIIFREIGGKAVDDGPFQLPVVATSNLPVFVEVIDGPAEISDQTSNQVTLTGEVGTVRIRASQAGNVLFNAADPVTQEFEVRLSRQAITFFGEAGSPAPGEVSDKTFGGGPFSVEAAADSGLAPDIAVQSGPAVVSSLESGEATISLIGAGTVVLSANQPGDETTAAAPEITRSFEVAQATQTINFEAPASAGEADPPLTLSASASSGLPVSFSVRSGPATINEDQLQFTGSGIVIVEATQPGNTDYLPATPVEASITVAPAVTGDQWRALSSGTSNNLLGVAFAGSDFLAVGENLTVTSSPDGESWRLRAAGGSGGVLRDLAYGGQPAAFLAIGEDGLPLVSVDGANWTARSDSGLPPLSGLVYGDGRFVAVGAGGVIRRSLDGNTWSTVASGVDTDLVDVAYGNGTYVAVGGNVVLVSRDGGTEWSVQTFPNPSMSLSAVTTDGAGAFMAVGAFGQILFSGDDGTSWNIRPGPSLEDLNAVVFGNDRYLVAGAGGAIHTSDDAGESWIARESGTTETLRDAAYRQDVFVIVGDAGTVLASGLSGPKIAQGLDFPELPQPAGDTIALEATALEGANPSQRKVRFSLIAGGGTISAPVLGADGKTTATLTITGDPGPYRVRAFLPGGNGYLAMPGVDREFIVPGVTPELGEAETDISEDLRGAAFGLGRYVAVGGVGAVARSLGGSAPVTDWEALVPVPTSRSLMDVAFGNDRFVAVGWNGTALVSTDGGASWTTVNVGTSNVLGSVVFGDDRFVAVERAADGRSFVSFDGLNWTAANLPGSFRPSDVAVRSAADGGRLFTVVGFAGFVATSPDGFTWTPRDIGTQNLSLESVTYGDGRFVALTSSGTYLFSSDGGASWIRRAIPAEVLGVDTNLSAIAFGDAAFRVVGTSGTMIRGPLAALDEPVDPATNQSRWKRDPSLVAEDLLNISFGGERFVVTGADGTVLISLSENGDPGGSPSPLPAFGALTPVDGTENTYQSSFLGRLVFQPGSNRTAFSESLGSTLSVIDGTVRSPFFGTLSSVGVQGAAQSSTLGTIYFGSDGATYGGWVRSVRLGWLKVEQLADGGEIAWVADWATWVARESDGIVRSYDFGRLELVEGQDYYRSDAFGTVYLGAYGGWFYSDRYGWVWAARDSGGTWFWSGGRNEWISVLPNGAIWSTARNAFL